MKNPLFSITIITFNSSGDIVELLNDIKKIDAALLKLTIVVDNDSQDNTVDVIKKHFPIK